MTVLNDIDLYNMFAQCRYATYDCFSIIQNCFFFHLLPLNRRITLDFRLTDHWWRHWTEYLATVSLYVGQVCPLSLCQVFFHRHIVGRYKLFCLKRTIFNYIVWNNRTWSTETNVVLVLQFHHGRACPFTTVIKIIVLFYLPTEYEVVIIFMDTLHLTPE